MARFNFARIIRFALLWSLPAVAPALAADTGVPNPSWTGFHVGVGGGYGMVNHALEASVADGAAFLDWDGIAAEGGFATFEAGYDLQLNSRFVMGVAADYSLQGVVTSIEAADEGVAYTLEQQNSVSILGRFGRKVDANNVLYNIVGWTHTWYDGNLGGGLASSNYDFALNGLTLGGGIESILADNLSIKLEYRYTMYQEIDIAPTIESDGLPIDVSDSAINATTHEQSIRGVLSYRIGAKAAPQDFESGAWTGLHIGVGGGKMFIDHELDAVSDILTADSEIGFSGLGAEGYFGSIELGADYQIGERFVVGLQGDYALSAIDTEISAGLTGLGSVGLTVEATDSFSILGRAGVLSSAKVLWYGIAGWTHGNFDRTISVLDGVGDSVFEDTSEFSVNGMTVGVGFEAMIMDNVSMKTEYRYTNYEAVDAFNFGDDIGISSLANAQSVRSVLSYRF